MNLDLSEVSLSSALTGRKGFPKEAMAAVFIVMKCEGFSQITDLADYLDNNRLIAHYCGFDITRDLPSYWTYDRLLAIALAAVITKSGSSYRCFKNCKRSA